MKHCKLCSLLLALAMCLSLTVFVSADETEGDIFAGTWYEIEVGKGVITITPAEGSYHITAEWPSSAAEVYSWDLTGKLNEADSTIQYEGKQTLTTFAADNTSTEKVVDDACAGVFQLISGQLYWNDGSDNEPTIFIREEYYGGDEGDGKYTSEVYAKAQDYVIYHGIMVGTDVGFEPEMTMTRAQAAQVLYNFEGQPEASADADTFADAEGKWYASASTWAKGSGLFGGYEDGTFRGDTVLNRVQLMAVLYRYAQFKGLDTSATQDTNILSYDDALTIPKWDGAAESFQWACAYSIYDTTLRSEPSTLGWDEEVQRGEFALMLMNYDLLAKSQPMADFLGDWQDSYSQRASMTISVSEKYGDAHVEIRWGDSASTTIVWDFSAAYDKDANELSYANGEKHSVSTDADGKETDELLWDDAEGKLTLDEEGILHWIDSKDSQSADTRFVKMQPSEE